MSEDAIGGKGRWTISAIGAIGVLLTLMYLFRLPTPPTALPTPAPAVPSRAALTMARPSEADQLLKEETELRDLRPLFLPTERNVALPDPRLEPGRTFLDNENLGPKFSDTEVQLSNDLPAVVTLGGASLGEARAIDALAPKGTDVAVTGFARATVAVKPFPARGGFVEVTALKDGEQILAEPLPVAARPPGEKGWAPLELLAVVDAAGLASPLVVVEGSRVEDVDVYFRNFLAREFRIGDRLAPGFYRIIVAP